MTFEIKGPVVANVIAIEPQEPSRHVAGHRVFRVIYCDNHVGLLVGTQAHWFSTSDAIDLARILTATAANLPR